MDFYRKLFYEHADSDGYINLLELELGNLGRPLSKKIIGQVCKFDENRKLDIGQFLAVILTEDIETDELYEIFRFLDKNGKKL